MASDLAYAAAAVAPVGSGHVRDLEMGSCQGTACGEAGPKCVQDAGHLSHGPMPRTGPGTAPTMRLTALPCATFLAAGVSWLLGFLFSHF